MTIAFDLTPVYDHLTGIERYNLNITKEIIIHHPENQYILLFKNEIHKDFETIAGKENTKVVIIKACNKLVFIQVRLLIALARIAADYYVFLSFTSPVLFKKDRIINAIHDMTCWDCPETMPTKMKYYYRFTYKVAAKRSWRLVTVSEFSQKQICNRYNLPKENVPVIYDGLTDIFKMESINNPGLSGKYDLPEKYILSLSTLEPRKNLQLLIRAYIDLLEDGMELPDLVLAGRQGWKLEEVAGNINDTVKQRIHFSGFIDDVDLPQLYRDADLFVFPSKYEGFGLPLIEAMSQGTFVISSDAASLPEVVGNAGLLFRSDDLQDLKNAFRTYYQLDEETKSKKRQLGLSRSHIFSWAVEAEKLYAIMIHESLC